MPPVFQTILTRNAMMLIWYLLYRMILVRSTHYQLKRVYLISGLTIPVILLLLDISPLIRKFQHLDIAIARMADQTVLIKGYGQIIDTENQRFFLYIYTCGLIIFSAQLLVQALSLKRLHSHSKVREFLGVQVRELQEDLPSFSFWSCIYLNPHTYSKEDTEMILRHEKVHIRQRHTIDIIVARIIETLFWFNPVTFMLRKNVQQNLEYLADREVLELGTNRRKYQYSLLRLSMKKTSTEIKNLYTGTDLRKRIIEMNRPKPSFINKAWNGIVPALAIACLCLVNTFQLHIAGHHAFYKQMIDPEFLQLQARAESQHLKKALGHLKLEQSSQQLNLKQEEIASSTSQKFN